MDTKEIIDKLERWNFQIDKVFKCYGLTIDEVIKRLQMWEDFKKLYGYKDMFWGGQGGQANFPENISKAMDNLEEKYFPKEIHNVIEVDVLASNHDVINELAKEIEEMNGRIFDKGKIRVISTRWAW